MEHQLINSEIDLRVLFLLAIYFIGATTSSARTLDDIIAKTSGSSKQPATAYNVSMSTTVAMGAQTMKDSGTLEFSPPDCYHVVLSGSKVSPAAATPPGLPGRMEALPGK